MVPVLLFSEPPVAGSLRTVDVGVGRLVREIPAAVEGESSGGTWLDFGLFGPRQLALELSKIFKSLVLPPDPYLPASDIRKMTSVPASMLTM